MLFSDPMINSPFSCTIYLQAIFHNVYKQNLCETKMVLFEPGSKPRLEAILLKDAGCGYWLTLWAFHVELNHIDWRRFHNETRKM